MVTKLIVLGEEQSMAGPSGLDDLSADCLRGRCNLESFGIAFDINTP